MATVVFMDSFLKPFVLRGLIIGGVLAYGFAGLFVGPVVLAVASDLANAWGVRIGAWIEKTFGDIRPA